MSVIQQLFMGKKPSSTPFVGTLTTLTTSSAFNRGYAKPVQLANGNILAFRNGTTVVESLNVTTAAWTTVGNLPATQSGLHAVDVNNGTIFASPYGVRAIYTSGDNGASWGTTIPPVTGGNTWASVAHDNAGVMVQSIYGNFPYIRSADYGGSWTGYTYTGSNNGGWGLVYANNIWVSAPPGGAFCMTSPDGITWTKRTITGATGWGAAKFANGKFVMLGLGGTNVATSTDGINWTMTASIAASAGQWYGLAYGNNTWVAMSSNGTFYISTDNAVSWSAGPTLSSTSVRYVTFNPTNNKFYIFPQAASTTVYQLS